MKKVRSKMSTFKISKKKGEPAGEEYRMYYARAKGNLFKYKRIMLDSTMKRKAEVARMKGLGIQSEALKTGKN